MATAASEQKSLPTLVKELRELVVAYARQETVEPLRGLVRFVLFGILGSFMIGIALLLFVVAGLRALETETGQHLTGNWSWAPYGIVTVACFVVAGLAVAAATRGGGKGKKQ
jgi:hypothetical protein